MLPGELLSPTSTQQALRGAFNKAPPCRPLFACRSHCEKFAVTQRHVGINEGTLIYKTPATII
ncbi:hypothetical protein BSLA_02r4407 [Burkholderia stabilis]|nr:hypothetical protein BSLA_02r4407 [Burkholderia stabilis]